MKIGNIVIVLVMVVLNALAGSAGAGPVCDEKDAACKKLAALAEEDQFEKIVGLANSAEKYSEASRDIIGKAYLMLAAKETNTPDQEEAFCRKALEFGAVQAYMGLYFINVQKDEEAALGFLRQYIATRPRDSVPYVLLGEAELIKKNYRLADEYLRESKKVARASSPRVDWMLFQANYLLGNFQYAGEMFESAVKNGRFEDELKSIARDIRFKGIAQRPGFQRHAPLLTGGDNPS